MKNRTQKIALACLLGGFLGALLALQFGHYFWWIGTLVGGLISYLAYDFYQVCQAARTCSTEILDAIPHQPRSMMICSLGFIGALMIMKGLASLVVELWIQRNNVIVFSTFIDIIIVMFAVIVLSIVIPLGILQYVVNSLLKGNEKSTAIAISLAFVGSLMYNTHPPLYLLGIPIIVSIWFLALIVCVLQKVVPIIGRVLKSAVLIIHSDKRLLCLADATIGASTGYFAGHAVIGGLVGSLLGVINYELVSKRWLKLVPTT